MPPSQSSQAAASIRELAGSLTEALRAASPDERAEISAELAGLREALDGLYAQPQSGPADPMNDLDALRIWSEATRSIFWTAGPDGMPRHPRSATKLFHPGNWSDYQGEGWLEPVHPEDRARVAEEWKAAVEQRRDYELTYRVRDLSGQYRWYVSRGVACCEPSGGFQGWVGASIDIHDQKEAEARLHENEARLHTLLDNLPVGILLTDAQGHFVITNPANLRLFGGEGATGDAAGPAGRYTLNSPDGRPFPAEDLPLVRALEHGEQARDVEMLIRHEDGSDVYTLINASPVRTADGAVSGAVAVIMDITDRKRAEIALRRGQEALRLSEERFRLAARAVPGIIYDWDLSTDTVYRSDGMLRILGISSDHAGPESDWWRSRVHPEDALRMLLEKDAILSGQMETFESEYRVRHEDSHWVYLLDRSYIIRDEEGRPVRIVGSSMDITQHKQDEQALRESEKRERQRAAELEAIFNAQKDAVIVNDRHGVPVRLNTAALPILGFDPIGMQPEEITERLHLAGGVKASVTVRALNGEEVVNEEKWFNERWFLASAVPMRDEAGIVIGAVTVLKDITSLKKAELTLQANARALEESEQREREKAAELEAMMDAVPAIVWIARDPNSHFIDGNRAAHEILQMRQGENLSKSAPQGAPSHFSLLHDGVQIQPDQLPVQLAAKGLVVRDIEIDLVFDNGTCVNLIGNATPLFDDAGKPRGAVSAFIDITRRKQLENSLKLVNSELFRINHALRRSEERFRIALSANRMVVFTCDRDLRYTWIHNPLLGYRKEEVEGKRDDELMPYENVAELIAAKQRVLETGQGGVREIKIHYYGEDHHFLMTLEPEVNDSGELVGLTCAALNITEQRKLELEQRERATQLEVQRRLMEFREKERQEIARDLHDGPIQTLVSAIFSMQFLKESFHDRQLQLELEQVGLNLKNTVRELRQVVNELRPPALIQFGLSKTLRIHAEDFRERHPEIQLELELEDDGARLPEQTRLSLFRICQESLNNVVRHANASKAWVRLALPPGTVVLEVEDNGRGFSLTEDLIAQTERGHFGMAGMKERAEAAGGQLRFSSLPGQGTRVTVTIPLEESFS